MRCQKIKQLLSPYIDLVLSEEEKTRVEEHLADCESCRQELTELKNTVKSIRDMEKLQAPSEFINELHERLSREKVTPFNKRNRNNHLVSSTSGWFAASVASIALIAGIYISSLVPFPMVASYFDKLPKVMAPSDGSLSQDIEKFLKEKEQQMKTALISRQQNKNEENTNSAPVAENKQQQVAVNPGVNSEDPSDQPLQPMIIKTVSLQMSGDSDQITDNIMQLAEANEGQVETANAQLMSGVSKVMTVRVLPEKADTVVTGVKSLGCQAEPMQTAQDVSGEYNNLKKRQAEVNEEITRLESEESLDIEEDKKMRAMLFEQSYLKGKIADLEENTKLVEINIMITDKSNH